MRGFISIPAREIFLGATTKEVLINVDLIRTVYLDKIGGKIVTVIAMTTGQWTTNMSIEEVEDAIYNAKNNL